ncbi:LacI family transcriptional regulator [Chitinophaga horti]|uniref:LacI family transcriptional regulator n=1 Tax=Chitinophaga horti TaxID=2920382 RepID=A0ABY6IX69_9BACT|nr:LacI family DNA-binding transcriptional regulator [Chitinophaga horti]UYQ91885.1 LacI family transcriptional regulator [Chitinophaga horti]
MEKKAPTIKEMARTLGISISAVSKALNNHPSIGLYTKERVARLAQKLNYVPNQAAIYFKQKKTCTIGVILPHLTDHFYTSILCGAETEAMQNGYNLIMCQSYDSLAREKELVAFMQKNRVDGVLVASSKETINYNHFQALESWNIPVVHMARQPKQYDCHSVISNVRDGARQAVNYFIEQGHRRIAHLNGPETMATSRERHSGYLDAHRAHQLPIHPELVQQTDFSRERNKQIVDSWMQQDEFPTAILAFKDLIVLEIMSLLKQYYPDKKEQVAVIGFGNHQLLQYMDHPPCASIEEQPAMIGQRATSLLLELMQLPGEQRSTSTTALDCKLVTYERP